METVITNILRDLGLTERQAVRDYALLNSSQKAAEFEQDCKVFENKYKMSFQEFENKLRSVDEEVFEKEDDYLEWKFAAEGAAYWREKIEQLKREQ
ncbi:MAG: hypothetical protein WCE54_19605 [Ignavibacteriaceae bacterium]